MCCEFLIWKLMLHLYAHVLCLYWGSANYLRHLILLSSLKVKGKRIWNQLVPNPNSPVAISFGWWATLHLRPCGVTVEKWSLKSPDTCPKSTCIHDETGSAVKHPESHGGALNDSCRQSFWGNSKVQLVLYENSWSECLGACILTGHENHLDCNGSYGSPVTEPWPIRPSKFSWSKP